MLALVLVVVVTLGISHGLVEPLVRLLTPVLGLGWLGWGALLLGAWLVAGATGSSGTDSTADPSPRDPDPLAPHGWPGPAGGTRVQSTKSIGPRGRSG
jgi:hypothetical protein